jgi:hypothetical protein
LSNTTLQHEVEAPTVPRRMRSIIGGSFQTGLVGRVDDAQIREPRSAKARSGARLEVATNKR